MEVTSFEQVDFSDPEELVKLKGVTIDDELLDQLIKSFDRKPKRMLKQKALKSGTAIKQKQDEIDRMKA